MHRQVHELLRCSGLQQNFSQVFLYESCIYLQILCSTRTQPSLLIEWLQSGPEMGSKRLTPTLPFCGSQPRPTLVFSTYVNLVPEALDGPIPAVVELGDVHGAFALLELLEAVQALTHVAEPTFVLSWSVAVPGRSFPCHVEVKLITTDFFWMTRSKVWRTFGRRSNPPEG